MKNDNLHKAKVAKNDEFYTMITDIEKELRHYKEHFRDKIVLCNCDDPEYSNFWKYFELNFEHLGLKKLISTHYEADKPSYKLEMVRDTNGDGRIDGKDIIRTQLSQNGDFRSPECVELLKEADIIVTNPPFSLFRPYVAQLMEYDKKFIILGNINAVTYKEIFPLIKDNKMWAGFSFNKTMEFIMPDTYEMKGKAYVDEQGRKHGFVPAIAWFTNLDIKKRHEELPLYKHYNEQDYPRYDNYDAINVDKVKDIPCDYYGVMGVPITYLDSHNPEQFEIAGGSIYDDTPCRIERDYIKLGYKFYRNNGSDSTSGALRDRTSPKVKRKGTSDYSISPEGECLSASYARIFIKRKESKFYSPTPPMVGIPTASRGG